MLGRYLLLGLAHPLRAAPEEALSWSPSSWGSLRPQKGPWCPSKATGAFKGTPGPEGFWILLWSTLALARSHSPP